MSTAGVFPTDCASSSAPLLRRAADGLRSLLAFVAAIVLIWLGLLPRPALAQDEVIRAQNYRSRDNGWDEDGSRRRRAPPPDDDRQDEIEGEMGVNARVGHIAFKTFGRNGSLSYIEALPYVMMDEHMLFTDIRLFTSNDLDPGGNFGLGYRYLMNDWDRVFGASLWYDADRTTGTLFNQTGLSLETYGQYVDGRANFYLPVGDTQQNISSAIGNARFSGNQILFDRFLRIGQAMAGGDVEAGFLFPGDFARDHGLRLYGGLYHFAGGEVPDINGYKARFEGYFTDNFFAQTEYTHDGTYGTNVTVGGAIVFSGGSPRSRTRSGKDTAKMRRFVQRNYNVIVPTETVVTRGFTAINPLTGLPYQVEHVSAGGNDGNTGGGSDPFATISKAQTIAGRDIIFVHSGTNIAGTVTLQPGDTIYGAGVNHVINVSRFGSLLLPDGANSGLARPTITAAGNGVVLANNSQLSGFVINAPGGYGITGTNVTNASVDHVDIMNANSDGIFLSGSSSGVSFSNMLIQDAGGAGFHVDGASGAISYGGLINHSTSGYSVLVANTTAGTVDLTGATITETGGSGLFFSNVGGNVSLGKTTVTNSTGTGIEVQGATGTIRAFGTTTIANAAGTGIDINGVNGTGVARFDDAHVTGGAGQIAVSAVNNTGTVSFGNLAATSTGATTLYAQNNGLLFVNGGTLAATNGTAADLNDSALGLRFTRVDSNNAAVGINIVDSTGSFLVTGGTANGSGGLIQSNTVGVNVVNSGTVALGFMTLDSNGTGVSLNNVDHFETQLVSVNNSTHFGIDALNTRQLYIQNSVLQNNGAAGDNAIRVRATVNGTYDTRIDNNQIVSPHGSAIVVQSSGAGNGSTMSLELIGNNIGNTRAGDTGLSVNWNGQLGATVSNNFIQGTAGSNVGVDIASNSTTQFTTLSFTNNRLMFSGGNDTGIHISTAGASNVTIMTTQIDLSGANSVGMDFSLAKQAALNLTTNNVIDHAGNATGYKFTSLAGASSLTLNDNWVGPGNSGVVLGRGFFFNAVDITNGQLSISSNKATTNRTANVLQPFTIPFGSATGQLFIDGVNVIP